MRTIALLAAALTLAACGNATMSSTGTGTSVTPLPSASTQVTAATPSTPCGGPTPSNGGLQGIVDRVDFVNVGGASFTTQLGTEPLAHPSRRSDLGVAVATVECQLSDRFSGVPPTPRTGDAAFLPPGTVLHAAAGFDPACRLLAVDDQGHLHVYLADEPNPTRRATKPCALDPAAAVS